MWQRLEEKKEALVRQYKEDAYEGGLAPDALRALFDEVDRKHEGCAMTERKAALMCAVMENARIEVRPDELFPDKIEHLGLLPAHSLAHHLTVYEDIEARFGKEIDHLPDGAVLAGLDFGHVAPHWERLFAIGVPGMLSALKEAAAKDDGTHALYYESGIRVTEALLSLLLRLTALAEAKNTPETRFAAKNLRALTEHAPETLGEGIQLIFLFHSLHMSIDAVRIRSLGAVDRLLGPLYERDLATGKYTEEALREILRDFLWKIRAMETTANLPFFLGKSERPEDLAFSLVLLEEYEALDIFDPKIHVLYRKGINEPLYTRVLELIRKGKSSFVFIGEETSRRALERIGIAPEHARDVGVYGCYEPVAIGTEVPCTCAAYLNFAKAVEMAVHAGVEYPDFDAFMAAVSETLLRFCRYTIDYERRCEAYSLDVCPAPLLSATYESSVTRGIDLYAPHMGGALYNNTSIIGAGIGTAADACLAVKTVVYEKKMLSLAAFAEILKNNFANEERLRLFCKKKCLKYGTGNAAADDLAAQLVHLFADTFNGVPNGRGGVFRIGVCSVDYRFKMGKNTGATPDGRLAGEPLSKNAAPSVGCDAGGVTAYLSSVTRFDGARIPNGCVADAILHKSAVAGAEGLVAMRGLLDYYMTEGGSAMHFNVLTVEELRAAQRDPDAYRNLQIRLCGWNVRFIDLSLAEQEEFILRAAQA